MKRLIIINPNQFGHNNATYYYCKYLKDDFDILYISWDEGLKKIEMAGDRRLFGILFLLAVIALVGMATSTPGTYWGPAIRRYINFISSVSLFILIVHAQYFRNIADDKIKYIEKLITALLLITVVHVFLSLLIFNYPWLEQYLSIFLRRTHEHLGEHIRDGIYVRATSMFTGGEEFGELLILLFPFALYRLFTSRKKLYWFIALSLLLGLVISGTRAALLLMGFQALVFVYILAPVRYNRRKFIITVSFAISVVLLMPLVLPYAPILLDRVQITLDQIGHKEDIIALANRATVWPQAYDLTRNTVSLFGHGPSQAAALGFPVNNFHNIYLSLIFQFGVIGSILFFTFFAILAKRLFALAKKTKTDSGQMYLLAISCLLSLFCFLINEIKFEFNRLDSYQQFVWCFFAVFYLLGTSYRKNYNK